MAIRIEFYNSKLKRIFDVLVVVVMAVAIAYVPILEAVSVASGRELALQQMLEALTFHCPVIPVMAVVAGLILLGWMVAGDGARSSLWNWLPPFVIFQPESEFGRWFLVVAISMVTIASGILMMLGYRNM